MMEVRAMDGIAAVLIVVCSVLSTQIHFVDLINFYPNSNHNRICIRECIRNNQLLSSSRL